MSNNRFATTKAPASDGSAIMFNDARISVLSNKIIRIEQGAFTDKRTQTVFCRNFAQTQFNVVKTKDKLSIHTDFCTFYVSYPSLAVSVEFITPVMGVKLASPSDSTNMGGTARTLDGANGALPDWKNGDVDDKGSKHRLHKGIFGTGGVAEYDDSKSFLLNEDGTVSPRDKIGVDKYVFAFGDDYLGGLKQFYMLTGFPPLLPKYALSNWWSRYHAYTDKEYLALMDKFKQNDVPITVATIDMDWHLVNRVPLFAETHQIQGRGWTGYTFDKKLFPDYKAFLKALKDRGLAITMNLHPRDGVRYFEQQYADMAKACGIDPATKKTVQFDLTDDKFLNAYFDILHHPYEEDGVDFWWIDWQQGTKSKMDGLDPLWLLNHYHYLDSCRNSKRGMILSRYAGVGSHRYPLGFSGDTFVSWKSLNFQPYFTSLASNVGYTWWSHDIGGHLYGVGDNELYLRWLQFGVFSPINRLHSSNIGKSKEPWLYKKVAPIAMNFMRLRHKLLPYLYTANVRCAQEGVPLIAPTYYYDASPVAKDDVYRNQYYFGENMYVCPVTKRGKKGETKLSIYLPDGDWIHFFSGEKYRGGRKYDIVCKLDDYPVFVKCGSIVPLLNNPNGNSTDFGDILVNVYPGECEYTLFDEGGSVHFAVERDGDGFRLFVTPRDGGENSFKKFTFALKAPAFKFENGAATFETDYPANGMSIKISKA